MQLKKTEINECWRVCARLGEISKWFRGPACSGGLCSTCAKAAFHKVDDIAAGSTDRADTQAGRQASWQGAHIHRQELGYHSVQSDTLP